MVCTDLSEAIWCTSLCSVSLKLSGQNLPKVLTHGRVHAMRDVGYPKNNIFLDSFSPSAMHVCIFLLLSSVAFSVHHGHHVSKHICSNAMVPAKYSRILIAMGIFKLIRCNALLWHCAESLCRDRHRLPS